MVGKAIVFELKILFVVSSLGFVSKASNVVQIHTNDGSTNYASAVRAWRDVLPSSQSKSLVADDEAIHAEIPRLHSSHTGAEANTFLDPAWKSQWYMQDYRTDADGPVMDHELLPVYNLGITGYKITVGIIADGIIDQPDIKGHYDTRLRYMGAPSYDPVTQLLDSREKGAVGTMAASAIAMQPNNHLCGVGVAYGANVTNLNLEMKMLSFHWESVLTWNLKKIDVYSTVATDRDMGMDANFKDATRVLKALAKGGTVGRGMNGAVYVYPAGDDKAAGESCASNLLANSRMTLVVGAANQRGRATAYSERCAAVIAAAYSGDRPGDEGIVAQDSYGTCVTSYSGTGAAVAIASGIIALALQANSALQVRDVMHLVTMTSEVAPLSDEPGTWRKNGAGFWVSQDFGFGLLNAHNMVRMAAQWTNVNRIVYCVLNFHTASDKNLEPNSSQTFETDTERTDCERPRGKGMRLKNVEQVNLRTTIRYDFRGAIQITLTSPSHTEVTMLPWRKGDVSSRGLTSWGLRAVHFWGENPKGTWTVNISVSQEAKSGMSAVFSMLARDVTKYLTLGMASRAYNVIKSLDLHLYGTEDLSYLHKMMMPRKYADFKIRRT